MLHVHLWAERCTKQSPFQESDNATLIKQCFWRIRIFSFIASLLFSPFAIAQTGSESEVQDLRAATAVQRPAQRSAPVPRTIQVEGWTVSGSLRIRFEDWDFFKAPPADSKYGYGASVLRVSLNRQFRSQDWLFELEQPSLIGLPSHAVAPVPQGQLGFGGTYRLANEAHPGRDLRHIFTP